MVTITMSSDSLCRFEEAMELLESLIGGEDVPEGVKLRLSR